MSEEKTNVLTPGYKFLEGLGKGDKLMFTSMIGGFAAFVAAGLILSSSLTPSAVEGFRINVGGGGGLSSTEMTAEDKMWFGGGNTFVPAEGLSKESGVGDIYEFVSDDVKTMLAQTAYALKVKGEMFSKTYDYGDGYSYTEHWWGFVDEAGEFDYSKPYVSSYSSDDQYPATWSYSVGYADYGFDYGVIEPFVGEDMVEPEVGLIEPDYRVEEPPKYDEKEAISQVKSFLTILGYSMNDFNLYANTDWGTNVTAEMMLDGQPTPISFNFSFNNAGLESAYGYGGSFVKQGEFGIVSPYDAVERINKQGYTSWAASSLYEKYNQSGFGLKDAVAYSEMGEPEGGGASGFNPDEAVSDDMMFEFYPSDVSTTEAAGVIVIYREGESPAFTDNMVVVGFENVKGAEFFSLGTQLADNMWSVQFNGVKTFEETQEIISVLENSGVFESVSGDWIISIMPPGGDMMRDNVEVTISKFETVWVVLYDTEGRMFITKGYIMTDADEEYGAHTVSAVDSAVLNIVEYVYVDGIPEPAFK
jgi:hypothetical protein